MAPLLGRLRSRPAAAGLGLYFTYRLSDTNFGLRINQDDASTPARLQALAHRPTGLEAKTLPFLSEQAANLTPLGGAAGFRHCQSYVRDLEEIAVSHPIVAATISAGQP